MAVIEFNHVWKKFRKGEKFNSLRDMIPNMVGNFFAVKKQVDQLAQSEFWAVKDVSFEVKKGEVVGVIGPNGAGKSTILKMLSGILTPNKGSMAIHGRLSALIEVTAGFHPELTGRENVYLNGTILGMKKKEIDAKLDQIVEFSGISEFIDTPVKRYSSGMYSRLGFSVAAHVDPDVLIVDEVLAVGDIAFQSKCAQKMRELLKGGVTIAIVSHNLPLIQSLCSRVILINKGQLMREGSADDVIPYYENIVFKQAEEQLRNKMETSEYKVKVKDDSTVTVSNVRIVDEMNQSRESFGYGSDLTVQVSFETKKRIEKPIFSVEILRADGVLCFGSDTQDDQYKVDFIEGKGVITVRLGKTNLAPGVYLPKITIWDQDLVHPFVMHRKDILRIEMQKGRKQNNAIFDSAFKWELNKG